MIFSRNLRFALPIAVGLALNCGALAADSPPPDKKPLPVALVDAFNVLSKGPHKGYRANHAKGIMVEGMFTPSPTASSFSKAPHFAKAVPVLVRFSDPTGVPTLPDADPNASPHGIAIRFTLPDGGPTDIVSISANGFPVATPEDFLAFLNENFYDLHYAPLPEAQPFSFGIGNLWRVAIEYPGSPVPPCIHRAPITHPGQPSRLLLLS